MSQSYRLPSPSPPQKKKKERKREKRCTKHNVHVYVNIHNDHTKFNMTEKKKPTSGGGGGEGGYDVQFILLLRCCDLENFIKVIQICIQM